MKSNLKTLQTWDQLSQLYHDNFMQVKLYDDSYDLFCIEVNKSNATILEIGCGPGNITKYLLNKCPDYSILATDDAPNMIQLASEVNPQAKFLVLDARDIKNLKERFDGIICGFCMPYLNKEECIQHIADCSFLLKNKGIFYFSVIEDDNDKSGLETSSDGKFTMLVYSHEESYLSNALLANNFEKPILIRKAYIKKDGSRATHLIFIAKRSI